MINLKNGRPLLIGVTGNIATGKSTVTEMLAQLGAVTIDADKVAHWVMRPGTPAHAEIVEVFGAGGTHCDPLGEPRILTADGEIDRARLGRLVFADREAMAQLEAIVHPATLEAIDRRIAATSADVVVVEAIKLLESGLAEQCHSVWVTTCRPEQQIARLVEERGLSRDEARERVEAQRSQKERAARADVVIDNAGSRCGTWEQVVAAWKRVVEGADSESEDLLGNKPSSGIIGN